MATSTPGKTGFKYIQFDTTTFVARITLNFPPYNVLTIPMMVELAEAIESLNGRGDVKCILLESSQKAFSYGISVEDSRPERVFQTLDAFIRVFQAIAEISKPLAEAMKKSQDIYLNQLYALEDVQEGLRAVVEKRQPVWKNK